MVNQGSPLGSRSREWCRFSHAQVEKTMTTFDDREKAFENKFAHDQDLKFKAEARRNTALAEWAAAKLGLTGAEVDAYAKAVRHADLLEKGDNDVFRKIRKDFDDKGVKIGDAEIRKAMDEFLAKAVHDMTSSKA
jgi:hypothetical protein